MLSCCHVIFFSLCLQCPLFLFVLILFCTVCSLSLFVTLFVSLLFLFPSTWVMWRRKYENSMHIFFRRRFSGPGGTWSGRPRSSVRASTGQRWGTVTGEHLIPEEIHTLTSQLLCTIFCALSMSEKMKWRPGDLGTGRYQAAVGI